MLTKDSDRSEFTLASMARACALVKGPSVAGGSMVMSMGCSASPVQSSFVQIYHEAPGLSCSPNRAPPAPRNFVILTWLAETETHRNMILLLLMGCGVVEITNPSSFSFVLTDSYLAAGGDVQPTGQNSQRCGRAMARRCQNARCRIYVEL